MFGVYSHGGTIGQAGIKLIAEFNTVEDARLKAKGLNAVLTRGEKRYFGMKYTVKKLNKSNCLVTDHTV